MPVARTVRSRGSTIVVEANAEVLFTRGGPVGNWARTFSNRATRFTAAAAPGNSRPTWGHEPAAHGRPLKTTFTSNTRYVPSMLRVFSAVGSSANYSAYVDQGTGVFNEASPWKAKVLPPTSQFGSDLYEHTWRPGGGRQGVREVWIKGQKPQYFFAHGLDRAFKSMHMVTATVPGTARLGSNVTSFPDDLANFAGGATPSDSAFRASLAQWRAQRDAAWNRGETLGRPGSNAHTRETDRRAAATAARYQKNRARLQRNKPSPAQVRAANRERQRKFREQVAKAKGKSITRRKPQRQARKTYNTPREKNNAALKIFRQRNPRVRILRQVSAGIVVELNGRRSTISWGQLYGLL